MAWTTPATAVTGDVITAAFWNTNGRDNLNETAAATAVAAGDLIYADGAHSMGGRLAASGNAGKFIRFNAAANELEAVAMPVVVPGPYWGSSFGTLYTARLGNTDNLYNSANQGGALLFDGNSGWTKAGSLVRITDAPTTTKTGDMNSASDFAAHRVSLTLAAGAYFASPQVVGGWEQIQAATKLLGTAPTTITIGMIANANITTTDAGDGFGITNDEDAAVGTTGVIAIINGSTNFEYRIGSAASVSLGVAKDTNAHLWEFVINVASMTMNIKVDGTARASSLALSQDEWPKSLFNRAITAVRWEHSFWWVQYE